MVTPVLTITPVIMERLASKRVRSKVMVAKWSIKRRNGADRDRRFREAGVLREVMIKISETAIPA